MKQQPQMSLSVRKGDRFQIAKLPFNGMFLYVVQTVNLGNIFYNYNSCSHLNQSCMLQVVNRRMS